MKFVIAACLCVLVVNAQNAQQPNNAQQAVTPGVPFTPKTGTRFLPADVLRDFPRACFGSTACSVFQVGETWPLAPFCGKATCETKTIDNIPRLIEKVEDCGPEPKVPAGCKLFTEPNSPALKEPYPACCLQYVCQAGSQLQYPTDEELRQAAAAGGPQGARNPQQQQQPGQNRQQAQAAARPTA